MSFSTALSHKSSASLVLSAAVPASDRRTSSRRTETVSRFDETTIVAARKTGLESYLLLQTSTILQERIDQRAAAAMGRVKLLI